MPIHPPASAIAAASPLFEVTNKAAVNALRLKHNGMKLGGDAEFYGEVPVVAEAFGIKGVQHYLENYPERADDVQAFLQLVTGNRLEPHAEGMHLNLKNVAKLVGSEMVTAPAIRPTKAGIAVLAELGNKKIDNPIVDKNTGEIKDLNRLLEALGLQECGFVKANAMGETPGVDKGSVLSSITGGIITLKNDKLSFNDHALARWNPPSTPGAGGKLGGS